MSDEEEEGEEAQVEIEESEDFPYEEGLTDIVLLVENKRLHLNKGFLMTSSPVFKAMFLGNFKEKTSTEIPLPEKNYEDMVAFLNCLLQNEENKLTDESAISVMHLAWEYQSMQLVRRCECHFMNGKLRLDVSDRWSIKTEFLMEVFYLGEICKRRTLVNKTLQFLQKRTHREIKGSKIYARLDGSLRFKLLENRLNEYDRS